MDKSTQKQKITATHQTKLINFHYTTKWLKFPTQNLIAK